MSVSHQFLCMPIKLESVRKSPKKYMLHDKFIHIRNGSLPNLVHLNVFLGLEQPQKNSQQDQKYCVIATK